VLHRSVVQSYVHVETLAYDTQPVVTLLVVLQDRVYVVTLPAVALTVTHEVQPLTMRISSTTTGMV
jgi:hypothetical protein